MPTYQSLLHAPDYHVFRGILLIADHNAYHLGKFIILRKVFPSGRILKETYETGCTNMQEVYSLREFLKGILMCSAGKIGGHKGE